MLHFAVIVISIINAAAYPEVDWKIIPKGKIDIDSKSTLNSDKMIVLDSIYNTKGNTIYSSLFSTKSNGIMSCSINDVHSPECVVKKMSRYIKSLNSITVDDKYIITDGLEVISINDLQSNNTSSEVKIFYPSGQFNKDERRCVFPSLKISHIYIIEGSTLYYAKYSFNESNTIFEIIKSIEIPYNFASQCNSIKVFEPMNKLFFFQKIDKDYFLQIVDIDTMTNNSIKMPIDFEIYTEVKEFYKIIQKGKAIIIKGQRRLYYVDLLINPLQLYNLNSSYSVFLPMYDDNFIVGINSDTFEFEITCIENPLMPRKMFSENIDENYFASLIFEDTKQKNIIVASSQKAKIYQLVMINYRESIESVKVLIICALLLLLISLAFIAYVCIMKIKREREQLSNPRKLPKLKAKGNPDTMVTEEAIETMAMDSWKFAIICPLSKKVMKDPVFLCDGYTYERKAIEDWLNDNNTSPTLNALLENKEIWPNVVLGNFIRKNVSGK